MGMLYRVCACLLGVLPVDNAGRRVFDETLADWRREGRTASGMLAVVRSVMLVFRRDCVSAPMGTMARRIVAWSALWLTLGLVGGRYVWGDQGGVLDVTNYAASAVVAAVFFVPAAVLLSALRLRTRMPALGLSVSLALLAVVLVGWAAPAASRHTFVGIPFPETWTLVAPEVTGTRALVRHTWPSVPMGFHDTHSTPELVALIGRGPYTGWGGIRQLSVQASFVALCVLVPFLAAVLRTWRRPARYAGFSVALVALLYQTQIEGFIAPDWILWMFVSTWVPVMMLAGLLSARVLLRTRAPEQLSTGTALSVRPNEREQCLLGHVIDSGAAGGEVIGDHREDEALT